MDIKTVGKRGALFTGYDLDGLMTNTYVIDGREHIFVLDTYLGPEFMEEVKRYIDKNFDKKPIVVFNSHSHWDHIWGNCAFMPCMIVSHGLCRDFIAKRGIDELYKHEKYTRGHVEILHPNITFSENLIFHEDGVEFFYSPGHTPDSASVIDRVDNVLFAGDNVELPLPYINWKDLNGYENTLQQYTNLNPQYIIAGHCDVSDKMLIEHNLKYIRDIKNGNMEEYIGEEYKATHLVNMNFLER